MIALKICIPSPQSEELEFQHYQHDNNLNGYQRSLSGLSARFYNESGADHSLSYDFGKQRERLRNILRD